MREKEIEARLKKEVEATGSLCLKMVSPAVNGVPDRLILSPGGRAVFAEVKAPGNRPRKIQSFMHRRLEKLGFAVFVVDSCEKIREVLNAL